MKTTRALLLVLALTACGTLEPNSSFSQLAQSTPAGQVPQPGQVTNPNGGPVATTPNGTPVVTTPNGTPVVTTPNGTPVVTTPNGTPAVTTPNGTTTGSTYNPALNTASDVGVTPTSITIGNVTGVTGALGPDAFGVTLTGLKVWVAAINAQGGINGRKIVLDFCDDAQDSSQNLTCTQSLVPKVFAFIGNNSLSSFGSGHVESQAGVPDIGFPLNNGYYKYPDMFSLYGTDYPRDGKQVGFNGTLENTAGIYRYFAEKRGITRAAFFFYMQTASSQAGKAAEQDAATVGLKTVYEGGGSQGENFAAPNFDSDIIAMNGMGKNKPQAMFDTIDVNGNQKLCQAMDRYGFTVEAKVSTIEVWDQSIGQGGWTAPCRDEVYTATGGLSYADSQYAPVAQYLNAFKTYAGGALQAEWSLQGWAVGQMFGDGLAALGPSPTRKAFIAWLDGLPPDTSPDVYNNHGLMGPVSYRVDDPKSPRPDCNTIVQWQDSVGTFVTRNPLTPCYQDPLIPSPSTPDGS